MSDPNIKSLQSALTSLGADPGLVDGLDGPKTRAAAVAWGQGATRKPALPVAAVSGLPWLDQAKMLVGTQETVGSGNSATIMKWAADAKIGGYTGDDIPWCGLFVAHCILSTMPGQKLPDNPLGARQWLTFGQSVPPQLGAVMVFWRGSKDGWLGHVAFYVGEDAGYYYVLGGNQSNAVNISKLDKARLLGARWPIGVSAPEAKVILTSGGNPLSTNEA